MPADNVAVPVMIGERMSATGAPRILFSANTSWYLYNYYRNTFLAFMERGYEVFVSSPVDGYTHKLMALGCVHIPLPMLPASKNPLQELRSVRHFFRIYRALRPDAVFHFTLKCNLYGSLAASLLGIPHANNVSGLGSGFNSAGPLKTLIQWMYMITQRKAGRIFFQTVADRDFMLQEGLVSSTQAALLPGSGVDLTHFRKTPRTEADKAGAAFTFVFAGRIIWEKGFPYLPDAMRIVKQKDPGIECHVYGFLEEGNPKYVSRSQLAEWESEGILSYQGPLEDVRKAYRASDCVVLPTYYREGVPKSLLEAAAMGKPIIATNVNGCTEAVKHGVNGLLCEARDAESLASTMLQMAHLDDEQRAQMGTNGRERVEASFGETRIIHAYLEIAGQLTHTPAPAGPLQSSARTVWSASEFSVSRRLV